MNDSTKEAGIGRTYGHKNVTTSIPFELWEAAKKRGYKWNYLMSKAIREQVKEDQGEGWKREAERLKTALMRASEQTAELFIKVADLEKKKTPNMFGGGK